MRVRGITLVLLLTAGPATYPYEAYFHKPWRGINTQADLDAARAAGKPVWVLYTLASYRITVDKCQGCTNAL